jgi:hypothetical protein
MIEIKRRVSKMNNTISINLQSIDGKTPPLWAIGKQDIRFWYYENEHGEQ